MVYPCGVSMWCIYVEYPCGESMWTIRVKAEDVLTIFLFVELILCG